MLTLFPIGTQKVLPLKTFAVLVEKHDQVITALRENWKRISSGGSGAKNEAGYTPGYARNVELRTVRLPRRGAIVRRRLVFRGRIGFLDSLYNFLQSQV